MSLEVASKKLIELNLIKPKTKIGLSSFLNLVFKWRNDSLRFSDENET